MEIVLLATKVAIYLCIGLWALVLILSNVTIGWVDENGEVIDLLEDVFSTITGAAIMSTPVCGVLIIILLFMSWSANG